MSLTRKTPLRRGTKPMKRGRVKPVNAKRRKKNHARAYGGADRIAFVKRMRCIATQGRCWGAIEVAHTVTGGMGRKADASKTVPLCAFHHGNLHDWGIKSFQFAYNLDLDAEAAKVETAWQEHQES